MNPVTEIVAIMKVAEGEDDFLFGTIRYWFISDPLPPGWMAVSYLQEKLEGQS